MTSPKKVVAPQAELLESVCRRVGQQRNVAARVSTLASFDDPLVRRVLNAAYNPYVRYGIKLSARDEIDLFALSDAEGGMDIDDPKFWDLLDTMSTSTASSATKLVALKTLMPTMNSQTASILMGILRKSVIKNVSVTTVNKAFKGMIPAFGVQLASKYNKRKLTFPCFVEPKYDGVRATAIVTASGDVQVQTRTGRDIPAAAYFHDELRTIARTHFERRKRAGITTDRAVVIDGELLGTDFNNTVSVFRSDKPAKSGHYMVFDVLPIEALTEESYVSEDYEVRRNMLEHLMSLVTVGKVKIAPVYRANSVTEVWDMYKAFTEKGLEGCIIKTPKGKWSRKRTADWMKIKAEESADLIIIGAFEGEGRLVGTLGGLIVDFKGVEVEVGSGFDDATRDKLWTMYLEDLLKVEMGKKDYTLLGSIAEVVYQEVTPAGSLRHPIFKRRRDDKKDVSF